MHCSPQASRRQSLPKSKHIHHPAPVSLTMAMASLVLPTACPKHASTRHPGVQTSATLRHQGPLPQKHTTQSTAPETYNSSNHKFDKWSVCRTLQHGQYLQVMQDAFLHAAYSQCILAVLACCILAVHAGRIPCMLHSCCDELSGRATGASCAFLSCCSVLIRGVICIKRPPLTSCSHSKWQ